MTSETPPTEVKPKSNAGWNIHAVIDRLDTIALFFACFTIAVFASVYYYKLELPDDKFLTFASFVSIIGVILFSYKWVQKQVLKGMTDNVMEAIDKGFEKQNKKLEVVETDIKTLLREVAYLRGRFEKEEKDSTNKPKSDS